MYTPPPYNPLLTEALIDQILAVIYRDMQQALDLVSGVPGSLPVFAEWDLAMRPVQQFPALLLTPDSENFDIEAPCYVTQKPIRITGGVVVAHQIPNMCARLLQRYMRAIYILLRASFEATPQDWTSQLELPPNVGNDTSAGLQPGALKLLWIEGLAYDELKRQKQALFAQAAVFSILAEVRET